MNKDKDLDGSNEGSSSKIQLSDSFQEIMYLQFLNLNVSYIIKPASQPVFDWYQIRNLTYAPGIVILSYESNNYNSTL